ncbi:MAG TPA: ferredoxin [Streptosporangiaceae bacterium]|nr:ferredoxin [Streptosporangiaceae bacterium]
MSQQTMRLRVNPIACSGHGSCAELLPEVITLDEWGYPLLAGDGAVPVGLAREARRVVTDCPALALALTADPASSAHAADSEGIQKKHRGPVEPGLAR